MAALLAYAADTEIGVFGKPSPLLFDTVAREAGLACDRLLMVGDDAEFDVSAAVALGLQAVLVRTGKGARNEPLLRDAGLADARVVDSVLDVARALPDLTDLADLAAETQS